MCNRPRHHCQRQSEERQQGRTQTVFTKSIRVITWPLKGLLLGLVRFYQLIISPLIPSRCRFYPTCSEYAREALREHGVFKGMLLSCWRLLRCQPLHPGGYDPVPKKKQPK